MYDHPFFEDPDPGEFTVAVLLLAFVLVLGAYGLHKHFKKDAPQPAPQQQENVLSKEQASRLSESAILNGTLTNVDVQGDQTVAVFEHQGYTFTARFPKGTTERMVRGFVARARERRPECPPVGRRQFCFGNWVGCSDPITVHGEIVCEVECSHIYAEDELCKELPRV